MDRRSQRSRLRLNAALRTLLRSQPLSGISVEQLTRHAGVTRPTFYAHYARIVDLLDEYLESLLAEVRARRDARAPGGNVLNEDAVAEMVAGILTDIGRFDLRLHAILDGVPGLTAEERFAATVEHLIRIDGPRVGDMERELSAAIMSGAFVGVLRDWCRNDRDAARMGRTFARFIFHGHFGAQLPQDKT